MCLIGCILCGKKMKDMTSYIHHIEQNHPTIAKKIKKRWKKEGLIK